MRYFLIGMPGSGKSTIGRYLADVLKLPVIDLDKLIEEEAGKSIPEIFEDSGEAGFRQLEQKILHTVISEHEDGIISTGGGTPCFFDNFVRMQQAGQTIYIDVPLDTLVMRTSKSAKRPLLKGDRAAKIKELLSARQPIYKQAELVYETGGRDSRDVAREIAVLLH